MFKFLVRKYLYLLWKRKCDYTIECKDCKYGCKYTGKCLLIETIQALK